MELSEKAPKQPTKQPETHTPKKRRWNIHTKHRTNNGAMGKMDKKQFQITPEQETPDIDHIAEEDWGKIEQITKPQTPPEIHTPGTTKIMTPPTYQKTYNA